MSERGVFAVDRGVFDHPMFDTPDPFTPREAWLWLISEAAWKPRRRRIGKALVELRRGQVGVTVRFLAAAWKWHRARVERYLARLRGDAMIETHAKTGITVITLCNYGRYQRVSLPNDDDVAFDAEQTQDTAETQPRHSRDTSGTKVDATSPWNSPVFRSEVAAGHAPSRQTRDTGETDARHIRDEREDTEGKEEESTPTPPERRGAAWKASVQKVFQDLREAYGYRPGDDDPDSPALTQLGKLLRGRGGRSPVAPVSADVLLAAARRYRAAHAEPFKRVALKRWLRERRFESTAPVQASLRTFGVVTGDAVPTRLSIDPRLDAVLLLLASELGHDGATVVASWFADVRLESVADGIVRLSTASKHKRSYLLSNYADRLVKLWGDDVQRVIVDVRSPAPAAAASERAVA